MFEECTPPIPVSRLLVRSGFGNAVGYVEAAASNNIQEITFLGSCLMWNDATVCGVRIRLKKLWVSGLTCGNPVRGDMRWFFIFPLCVVSIGMARYWQRSFRSRGLRHSVIMSSLGQRMPCAYNRVCWNFLLMSICVTPVRVVGWSCRFILPILRILVGS